MRLVLSRSRGWSGLLVSPLVVEQLQVAVAGWARAAPQVVLPIVGVVGNLWQAVGWLQRWEEPF